MNYFSFLCFFWALIGIVSRISMFVMKNKWNTWELNKVYSEIKPLWVNIICIFGITLIILTWVMVFITQIKHSWIIAALISITGIKVIMLLFNYDKFRRFVNNALYNKDKMIIINVSVIVLSILLIWMGLVVY